MSFQEETNGSNDQVLRMVNEFKARPMLWDPDHDLYRVHTAKYEAWSEIARMFDYDVTDLRRKFNSIFASHRREKARVRSGNKSKWFLYDQLSFLPSHVNNLKNSSNKKSARRSIQSQYKQNDDKETMDEEDEDVQGNNTDNSYEDTEFVQEEIIIKNEPEDEPLPKRVINYRRPRIVRPIRPSIRRHVITRDRGIAESLKVVKASPTKGKDECDSFGEYIAVSLRKHDERSRSMIKQAINNILFEQEMKKYNNTYVEVERNPLIISGVADDE